MAVMSNDEIGKKICDALGLKHARMVDVHIVFAVDEIVTVMVEYYPEKDGILQLPAILKEYELVEKEKK